VSRAAPAAARREHVAASPATGFAVGGNVSHPDRKPLFDDWRFF